MIHVKQIPYYRTILWLTAINTVGLAWQIVVWLRG